MKKENFCMNTATFDNIYALMANSFPESELRTYEEQKKLLSHPRYQLCLKTDEEGRIAGVMAVWNITGFRFVEHLAVDPQKRNGGIGRKLLTDFLVAAPTPVVLEVEPPTGELEARRIAFYKRLGFHLNDYTYAQPPLRPGQPLLPLMLMSFPSPLSEQQFQLCRDTLYREVYGYIRPQQQQQQQQ
jgi:ribosomal protein S18 acetylase RimI-like enzyme